ncbi:MAG: serine O-acetyltransferase [Clostridiales bacterium]|nr:serine O-acetyltransferase [Clostridiales bacterium]
MFTTLKNDIQCIKMRDPAVKSTWEVLFCYPGFRALRRHRRANWLYRHKFTLCARMVSDRTRFLTGIDIHPAAQIGQRVFIDHGSGVVIGETTEIGNDVTIYQGSTLGGTGKLTGKRHPTVGNHVTISAGSAVLGPVLLGDYCKVGAGAVVLTDIPPYATVVGVPGRIVRMRKACGDCEDSACTHCGKVEAQAGEEGVDLDQIHLPDPIKAELDALAERIKLLEDKQKC